MRVVSHRTSLYDPKGRLSIMEGTSRDACAYLGQGGKASSVGTSMYMYASSQE